MGRNRHVTHMVGCSVCDGVCARADQRVGDRNRLHALGAHGRLRVLPAAWPDVPGMMRKLTALGMKVRAHRYPVRVSLSVTNVPVSKHRDFVVIWR